MTLDLWHTLVYVTPEDEERYMANQVRIAAGSLARGTLRAGARALEPDALARIFEQEYADAVEAAADGRTVTPAAQIERAAHAAGRSIDEARYFQELRAEVERLDFRRAPGALELLRGLREDGYRIAVISNTIGEPGAFLRPALRSMGFDPYIERYVFSDEQTWSKPDPRIFLLALSAIDATPDRAVHVGDGWSDIEGALRAGYRGRILFAGLQEYGERYRSLFASSARKIPPADREVTHLAEIGTIVRELVPPRPA